MCVLVVLAIYASIAAVSGVPAQLQRIAGGTQTTIESYPNIAALLYSGNGEDYVHHCGGTIITNRAVLTAAHCVHKDSVWSWRVRVGSTWANSGGLVHDLQAIRVHNGYEPATLDNDIAILRTTSTIVYSGVIKKASIAGPNYPLGDNEVVYAAGWGLISPDGPKSEQLRHVKIWTVNQAICSSRYASINARVTNNMLCSGWLDVGERDQCEGDSGGPLYHKGVLIGVCSWGYSCGHPYYPGINTRVSRYASWIKSNA